RVASLARNRDGAGISTRTRWAFGQEIGRSRDYARGVVAGVAAHQRGFYRPGKSPGTAAGRWIVAFVRRRFSRAVFPIRNRRKTAARGAREVSARHLAPHRRRRGRIQESEA